jgi:hypothetical protein
MGNAIVIVTVFVMSMTVHGQMRKVDFEQDIVAQPPKGFAFGHTRKVGTPGRWVVQQDGGGKYLAQLDADRSSRRSPPCRFGPRSCCCRSRTSWVSTAFFESERR